MADIETKFTKAPKLKDEIVIKKIEELRTLGPSRTRGKYEIQFLFAFLNFIKNEPRRNRVYSVASCSLPFQQNTMISTFSQYADVTERLYLYIETGTRTD